MKKMSNWFWALAVAFVSPVLAFANEAAAVTTATPSWAIPFSALGLAIAVFAAAGAQGRIASSYMEGVSRNPNAEKVMKTQLILSLVFVETLVIFTLGIVAVIVFK